MHNFHLNPGVKRFFWFSTVTVSALASSVNAQALKPKTAKPTFTLKPVWLESNTIEPSYYKGGTIAKPARKQIAPIAHSQFKRVHSAAHWDSENQLWYGTVQSTFPRANFKLNRSDGLTDTYDWSWSSGAGGLPNQHGDTITLQFRLSNPGSVALNSSSWVKAAGRDPALPVASSFAKMDITWHPQYDNIAYSNVTQLVEYASSKGMTLPNGKTVLVPTDEGVTVLAVSRPANRYLQGAWGVATYVVGFVTAGGTTAFGVQTPAGVSGALGAFGVYLSSNAPVDETYSGTFDYVMWARSVHADQNPSVGQPQYITVYPPSALNQMTTPGKANDVYWQGCRLTDVDLRFNYSKSDWKADEFNDNGYVGSASGTRRLPNGAPTLMGYFSVDPLQ